MVPNPLLVWRDRYMPKLGATIGHFKKLVERTETDLDGLYQRLSAMNAAYPITSPEEAKKEQKKALCHAIDFRRNRLETLERIRKLARGSYGFNVVGGVAPIGSMSGAGGMDGATPIMRPQSLAPRSGG